MDNWSVLGIEKTSDTVKIKEAYMEKLSTVHPEEDPEGFKRLRSAYEEANKAATMEEEQGEEKEESKIDLWIKRVSEVYNTFSLRRDYKVWEELLNDEVCLALDSKEASRDRLLGFLLKAFYLPDKVWKLINETFYIKENEVELNEYFPKQFITYILNEIAYGDELNYSLFEVDDSKDYDGFIKLYFNIRGDLNREELEDIENKFKELKAFNIYHPYMEVLEIRKSLIIKEFIVGKEIGEKLLKEYPREIEILYAMAEVNWAIKDFNKAREFYEKVLEIKPSHVNGRIGVADCKVQLEEYIEAEKMYREILSENPYNAYVRGSIYKCNEKIIEDYYERIKENEEDDKLKITLLWGLFENFRYEEAIELGKTIRPKIENECEYYTAMGKINLANENYVEAFEYFKIWIERLEEDEEKNKENLGYAYFQAGRTLYKLREYEKSLECYDEAIKNSPKETMYLNNKASSLVMLRRFEEAIEISNESIQIDDKVAESYINRGEAYYSIFEFNKAIEDADIAINIYPFFVDAHLVKIKVLEVYEEYEEILEFIKEMEGLEIENDEIMMHKMRSLSYLRRFDEAKEIGYKLLDKIKNNTFENHVVRDDVYFEMSILMMYDENQIKALEYINEAIRLDGKSIRNKNYRAYVYKNLNDYDKAIAEYEEIIKEDKTLTNPYLQIGLIHELNERFEMAIDWFKKALEVDREESIANLRISEVYEKMGDISKAIFYATKQIEVEESAYIYIHRGILNSTESKIGAALNDYKRALEIEPENKYAYNNIGCLYKDEKNYKEAIKFYAKSIELNDEPSFTNPYMSILDCIIFENDEEIFKKYFNIAVEDLGELDDLYLKKGEIEIANKKYKEAIESTEIAKRLNLENPDVYDQLSGIYCAMGDTESAYRLILKAYELDETDDGIAHTLALYEGERKNYKKAVEYLEHAIGISNPEAAYAYRIMLAQIYKKWGKVFSAKRLAKKALKFLFNEKDKKPCDYYRIAECYCILGDKRMIKYYVEKTIEEKKEYAQCDKKDCYEVYKVLALLEYEEGNYKKAIEYYEYAMEIKEYIDIECMLLIKRIKEECNMDYI